MKAAAIALMTAQAAIARWLALSTAKARPRDAELNPFVEFLESAPERELGPTKP
jgi:hypothetical protein